MVINVILLPLGLSFIVPMFQNRHGAPCLSAALSPPIVNGVGTVLPPSHSPYLVPEGYVYIM
jgi:hypothetical protein